MRHVVVALAGALSLTACVTPRAPAGEAVPLEDLIRQVKKDIGEYNAYAAAHANNAPLPNACRGQIDLTIKAVTVSVTTSAKITDGVTAGAQVTPDPFVKIGLSGGLGRSLANSQVLTFTLVPATPGEGRAVAAQPSALFHVLTNLRESLLRSGDTTPCLQFPEGEQKNSVEFGFTATKSANAGIGVNLFIFSLGASHGDERTAAHKITIAFMGEGVAIQ